MERWMIVLIAGVFLLIASSVSWEVIGKQRFKGLMRRFNTGAARVVTTFGSRSRAGALLASRTRRMERLDVRPLLAGGHVRFADKSPSSQTFFVENPSVAIRDIEPLVGQAMRTQGRPGGNLHQQVAAMPVDQPRFAENYRVARDAALAIQRGAAQTEDFRTATEQYMARFEDLLETSAQLNLR